ncbi:MAG: hypothetical protein PHV42_00030 [Candidatus Pacebacteria bacterium]|nr:hypothetical protein [Candidatus Paceibacterota bacterium]
MKKIFLFTIILSLFGSVSVARAISTTTDQIIATTTPAVLATPMPIHGGTSYDTATPLSFGSYTLDHNQKNGNYDYFTLPATPGNTFTITLITSDKGVGYDAPSNSFVPSNQINAGLRIMDKDHTDINDISIVTALQKDSIVYTPNSTSTLYLLVGPLQTEYSNVYYSMNKDTIFKIESGAPTPVPATPTPDLGAIPTPNPDTTGTNLFSGTMLYVIIGIGVLILLLLIILIAKMSKRNKPPQIPPSMMPPTMRPPTYTPPSSMPPGTAPMSIPTPPMQRPPMYTPPATMAPPVQVMPTVPIQPPRPAYVPPTVTPPVMTTPPAPVTPTSMPTTPPPTPLQQTPPAPPAPTRTMPPSGL